MASSSGVIHDHFVLLLNNEEFESPPAWLTDNFKIIEGGTHSRRSSRNKLIIFKDGTYLELFNWISEPAEFLGWADKQPGLIDFALTTLSPISAEQVYGNIQNNLLQLSADSDLGVAYTEPQPGARNRTDGVEVRWKASRPLFQTTNATPNEKYFPHGRVDVPFFCHDVTERTVRVPFDNDELTEHPSGAVGIDSLSILVPSSHFDAYAHLYEAIIGTKGFRTDGDDLKFQVGVPNPVTPQSTHITLVSSDGTYTAPTSRSENQKFLSARGIGISSIKLRVSASRASHKGAVPLGTDPIARTIFLVT